MGRGPRSSAKSPLGDFITTEANLFLAPGGYRTAIYSPPADRVSRRGYSDRDNPGSPSCSMHAWPRRRAGLRIDQAARVCCYATGIHIVKIGKQKPQNLSFPLHDVDPHLIVQCPTTQRTSPNRSSDGSRTFAQLRRKVPIGYNGRPIFCLLYTSDAADE